MSIPQILKENRFYTRLLLLFGAAGLLILNKAKFKGEIVLMVNGAHNPFLDSFFKYITYLGDGFFIIPFAVLIFLFRNRYQGLLILIIYGVNSAIIQFMKRVIYADMERPYEVLHQGLGYAYHQVEGVYINSIHSFPSGHANSGFAFFMALTFISKDKRWGMLFFFIALAVGVSRMYLFQHFFIDVYAGMMYAFFITLGVYHLITKKTNWETTLNTPLISKKR